MAQPSVYHHQSAKLINHNTGDDNNSVMLKLSQLDLGDSKRLQLPNGNHYEAESSAKPVKFIPSIPDSFCFVDENFHSDAFSVDGFVKRNSKRVNSLEKLKEELTSYQKILKHSMVELINEDYTEFINLSANLISFDKSIGNIKTPILKIKEETSHVQSRIEDIIVQLTAKQNRLNAIRENKLRISMILEISSNLKRVEAILPSVISSMRTDVGTSENESTSTHLLMVDSTLEETATLIARIQLNFDYLSERNLQDCISTSNANSAQLLPKLKHRFEVCSRQFYNLLERKLYYLLSYDLEKLTANERRCDLICRSVEKIIRYYLLSDNQAKLESIISEHLIKPAFDELICDAYITKNGVQSMFDGVLSFLDSHCALLIKVLTSTAFSEDDDQSRPTEEEGSTSSDRLSTLGYELLTRTVWRHFVDDCIVRCSALFSLANADVFYRNYVTTCRFTENLLQKTGLVAYRERFETEPTYHQLKGKFNLNVYFLMKLQQIVPTIEKGFQECRFSLAQSGQSGYRTQVATLVHDCLFKCWTLSSDQQQQAIFVGDLFGYLWKISLKIVARFASWIAAVDANAIAEWVGVGENNRFRGGRGNHQQVLAMLISDSQQLMANFASLYQTVITPLWVNFYERMQAKIDAAAATGNRRIGSLERRSLDDSLGEALGAFHTVATQHLVHLMKAEMTTECRPLLDIVNDIPRLYRRTNKEKPARASAYVARSVEKLSELYGLIDGPNGQYPWKSAWLAEVLSELSGHYRNATLEVLTSVQKTEDSLKKLKKANSKMPNANRAAASSMSDDDKIRLQIYFDVQELGVEVQRRLNFDLHSVKPYRELAEMVDSLKILL